MTTLTTKTEKLVGTCYATSLLKKVIEGRMNGRKNLIGQGKCYWTGGCKKNTLQNGLFTAKEDGRRQN